MKISIKKPPMPILWLDTWCILELESKLNRGSFREKLWAEEITELIKLLTKQKKLLCPEADQGLEIELSNNKKIVKNAQRILAQLSLGISLHFHATVQNLQTRLMMKAVINNNDVIFDWKDLFSENPIKIIDRNDKFIISVVSNPPKKQIGKTLKMYKSISSEWERLRKSARKSKQDYETTLDLEYGGRANAMMHIMALLAVKKIYNKRITVHDLLTADELIGKPLTWWEQYSGNRDSLLDVLKFYKSEEYRNIPTVNIGTRLLAELACGNEIIKPSDVMDIHHISTIMPYAEYMVVDNRMRNRVVDKLKLVEDYPCRILKLVDLLPSLKTL